MLDPSTFRYDQKASVALTVLSERAQDGATIQYAMMFSSKLSFRPYLSGEARLMVVVNR